MSHIKEIVSKAHRRANLSIRCFMSRYLSSSVKGSTVYVRPVSEYCSVVCCRFLLKDIIAIEKVQICFTKRLIGISGLTYHQRLVKVGLESLELRRIRTDLVRAYKITFGFTDVNSESIFTVRASNSRSGHCYKLYMPCSKSTARYCYCNCRVVRNWMICHVMKFISRHSTIFVIV